MYECFKTNMHDNLSHININFKKEVKTRGNVIYSDSFSKKLISIKISKEIFFSLWKMSQTDKKMINDFPSDRLMNSQISDFSCSFRF